MILLAENTFNEFFIAKNVEKADQVKLILGMFKDAHICNWISTDCERLLKLSFEEFIAELRTNFLPTDWVDTIRISLLGKTMSPNTKFWDYAQEVRALNIVLHGTPSYLEEQALGNHLEAHLEPTLQLECIRNKLYKVTTLKEWIKHICKINEWLTIERKQYHDIFMEESNLCANKHPTLGSSHIPNATANSNMPSSSSTQKPFTCLPKLTDGEKDLLCAHSGCFKCCRFNAGHSSSFPLCTSFPAGAGYKTITKYADVAGQLAIKGTRVSKPKVVASTIEEVKSEDNFVTAFAPSAFLGNRTDSGGSDNVSDLGPLKCKHFIWNCTIDGPLSEFPLKVSALVDNGCHLMLIRPDIVQKLGLPIHTLHTPEPVDIAIKNGKEKQKCILKEFVILGVTSIDQQWSSKRIQAIITPNLCMPLILGVRLRTIKRDSRQP